MKILSILILSLFSVLAWSEEVPDKVKAIVPSVMAWGSDPILVTAVKQQNATQLTLDAIKKRDAEWRKVDGLDDQMKAMIGSTAGKRMLELEVSKPYFFELFLMDNQGANVAMTNKTSDYWQGDEAKWQKTFADGKGALHVGDVEFDESAQDYLVQLSVPVMDGDKAIGALTIGVNLDDLEAN